MHTPRLGSIGPRHLAAVLFDRDGTLIHDVPYNGDPRLVEPVPHAAEALARLREAGIRIGVVTNQSGIGRGLITREQAGAVNDRVDELLGPFGSWQMCPHAPDDGCRCRKPAPGMVLAACRELGVEPADAVLVGDIAADMEAARRAGARGILVPTPVTLEREVREAEAVAPDLVAAVGLVLDASPTVAEAGGAR